MKPVLRTIAVSSHSYHPWHFDSTRCMVHDLVYLYRTNISIIRYKHIMSLLNKYPDFCKPDSPLALLLFLPQTSITRFSVHTLNFYHRILSPLFLSAINDTLMLSTSLGSIYKGFHTWLISYFPHRITYHNSTSTFHTVFRLNNFEMFQHNRDTHLMNLFNQYRGVTNSNGGQRSNASFFGMDWSVRTHQLFTLHSPC